MKRKKFYIILENERLLEWLPQRSVAIMHLNQIMDADEGLMKACDTCGPYYVELLECQSIAFGSLERGQEGQLKKRMQVKVNDEC